MIRVMFFLLAVCLAMPITQPGLAQDAPVTDPTDEEKIHAELSLLLERRMKAYQSHDLEELIKDVGPDIIITWQNAERNRGPEEFRSFYKKMMEGENAIVKDVKTTFEFDGTSKLYGDSTAVACGNITDDFILNDGKTFTLHGKWTATLAKTDDQWQVVSYHVSANVFDNPILTVAKSYLITFATVGAVLGFVLGGFLMWFVMSSSRRLVNEL